MAIAWLGTPAPSAAQERILSYDSEVQVFADGTLEITERIRVRAEGSQIRRGIYRDFPTVYRDRYGNRVRVAFEVIGVERNGATEAWFTERVNNGVRVNTGGDDFLPVPAEYTFTLRFRTNRQLGFFAEHDELYWNAIGTGWSIPIESGTVEVRLPAEVPVSAMSAEGHTGPQGERGSAYAAELTGPGAARYRLTAPLAPGEGFTIVLTFPKGIVAEPASDERAKWFLADNRGVLVAIAGFLLFVLYCVTAWWRVGRDPRPGIIIPRYRPPEGHTPGLLRYVRRMGYDNRCFTGDLLALAVGGFVRIVQGERTLRKDTWRLERIEGAPGEPASKSQRTLLTRLLPHTRATLELKDTNAATIGGAQQAFWKALEEAASPTYFRRNGGKVGLASLIALASAIIASAISGGNGLPVIVMLAGIMFIGLFVFGRLIKAPTPEGRRLMDEVEGLRLYLSVAERDELARLAGPAADAPTQLDAAEYEVLLPFAVALDVEDAWTKQFTAAVGAAAAAEATSRMSWYSGSGRVTDIGSFTKSIGSSLNSTISSSSSPPGSSSGSGGGGSSGGGGGGGGGGGR